MDRQERRKIKHDEFVDSTFRLFQYLEDHPKPFLFGAGAIVVLVVAVFGVSQLSRAWSNRAADQLSRGLAAFDGTVTTSEAPRPNDAYRPVFSSDQARAREAAARLESAAGATGNPGMLARYLRGIALLQAGDAAAALPLLEDAAGSLGSDPTLGVSVKAALAEACDASGKAGKAVELWRELARDGSGYPRDVALVALARTLEKSGKREEARGVFQQIVDGFPDSPSTAIARAGLTRLGR